MKGLKQELTMGRKVSGNMIIKALQDGLVLYAYGNFIPQLKLLKCSVIADVLALKSKLGNQQNM